MQTTYQNAEGMQQYARQGDTDCNPLPDATTTITKMVTEDDLDEALRPLYRAIHGSAPCSGHMKWMK